MISATSTRTSMLKQIAEKSIRLRWRWSRAGQLDWWVKERQQWLGRVRGADGVTSMGVVFDPVSA
jgi:hypothetical protein